MPRKLLFALLILGLGALYLASQNQPDPVDIVCSGPRDNYHCGEPALYAPAAGGDVRLTFRGHSMDFPTVGDAQAYVKSQTGRKSR